MHNNPLTGPTASQFDEGLEEKALANQVASIVDGVDCVSMDTTPVSAAAAKATTPSKRRREADEVADLLEDLDDLEGETMELKSEQVRSAPPAETQEIDLLKARKKN